MSPGPVRSRAGAWPHCGSGRCLSTPRKLTLGPSASARCRACGFKVGVDVARACLALLPLAAIVVLAASRLLTDPVALVVLLGVCVVTSVVLYAAWVPLRPDELTNAGMVEAARRARNAR